MISNNDDEFNLDKIYSENLFNKQISNENDFLYSYNKNFNNTDDFLKFKLGFTEDTDNNINNQNITNMFNINNTKNEVTSYLQQPNVHNSDNIIPSFDNVWKNKKNAYFNFKTQPQEKKRKISESNSNGEISNNSTLSETAQTKSNLNIVASNKSVSNKVSESSNKNIKFFTSSNINNKYDNYDTISTTKSFNKSVTFKVNKDLTQIEMELNNGNLNKKELRALKNRISAQRSRDRKNEEFNILREITDKLTNENKNLIGELSKKDKIIEDLHKQLQLLSKGSNKDNTGLQRQSSYSSSLYVNTNSSDFTNIGNFNNDSTNNTNNLSNANGINNINNINNFNNVNNVNNLVEMNAMNIGSSTSSKYLLYTSFLVVACIVCSVYVPELYRIQPNTFVDVNNVNRVNMDNYRISGKQMNEVPQRRLLIQTNSTLSNGFSNSNSNSYLKLNHNSNSNTHGNMNSNNNTTNSTIISDNHSKCANNISILVNKTKKRNLSYRPRTPFLSRLRFGWIASIKRKLSLNFIKYNPWNKNNTLLLHNSTNLYNNNSLGNCTNSNSTNKIVLNQEGTYNNTWANYSIYNNNDYYSKSSKLDYYVGKDNTNSNSNTNSNTNTKYNLKYYKSNELSNTNSAKTIRFLGTNIDPILLRTWEMSIQIISKSKTKTISDNKSLMPKFKTQEPLDYCSNEISLLYAEYLKFLNLVRKSSICVRTSLLLDFRHFLEVNQERMYKRNGKFADYLFDRMDIDLPEDIQKSKVNEPAEVKPNNQNSTSNKYKNIQPLTVSNSEFEILSNKSRNENFKIVSELPATFQNNSTQVKSLQKMFEQSKLRLNFKDNKCYMWNNINNTIPSNNTTTNNNNKNTYSSISNLREEFSNLEFKITNDNDKYDKNEELSIGKNKDNTKRNDYNLICKIDKSRN